MSGFRKASWRDIREIVSRADVVLEVLDARDPPSTMSKKLEEIVASLGKKLVLVLNKADLVPRSVAEEWTRLLRSRGYSAVYTAATLHRGTRVLRREIKRVADSLPVVVAVTGYPKTGKSSIINALKGKRSASTSSIPGSYGYTRHAQLYRVDRNLLLIDTPGVIPVEGSWLERAIRGVSPDQLADPVAPAVELIKKILENNEDAFVKAYGIQESDPMKIIEAVAIKRGWFYKTTREPLIEEAAKAIIRDFHEGKIPYYVRPTSRWLQ